MFRAHVLIIMRSKLHYTASDIITPRCDDIRGCVIQICPPDDEHMCSKHVEAWNKVIVKQKCYASSWLITKINVLRCTVSKTSKVICLCIANIFSEYSQQEATFHNLFISVRRSACFRRFFRPSSGAQNCTYSVRYLSDRYCYLLLACNGLYVQFWAPNDGRKTGLKHLERLTEINKLWNVASLWLHSANSFKSFLAHTFFLVRFLNRPILIPSSVVPILHIPEFILYTFSSHLKTSLPRTKSLSSSFSHFPFRPRLCILYCWHRRLLQYRLMCRDSVPRRLFWRRSNSVSSQ